MVQVPTKESGLTVKVPIKRGDLTRITNIVRSVVGLGDIPCKLNGTLLPTLKMSFEPAHVNIIEEDYGRRWVNTIDYLNTGILIRYANVVYPLFVKDTEYPELHEVLKKISVFKPSGHNIIIQAYPDSLSLNPSRESISMTDFSVLSLTNLLTKTYANLMTVYDGVVADAQAKFNHTLAEANLYDVSQVWLYGHKLRRVVDAIVEEEEPKYSNHQRYFLRHWANEDSYNNKAKAETIFLHKYRTLDNTPMRNVDLDIALLRLCYLRRGVFPYVYQRIIKAVSGLNLKNLAFYGAMDGRTTTIDQVTFSSKSLILQLLKRKVLIARTAKELNDSREINSTCLMIRYADAANQKKLIDLLESLDVDYEDLTGTIPPPKKREVPTVADYINGVPLYLGGWNTRTTDVSVLIVERSDGTYVTHDGTQVRHAAISAIQNYSNLNIGVVPTVTIAKSLTKKWNLSTVNETAIKVMQDYWNANKEQWIQQSVSIGKVVDCLNSVMGNVREIRNLPRRAYTRHRTAYLYRILEESYKDFRYKYADNTKQGNAFVSKWRDLLWSISREDTSAKDAEKLLNKTVVVSDLPAPLVLRATAVALWAHWDAFDADEFVDNDLVMSFIDQQLRKLENEYRNKNGSHSRNYGYYHPIR